MSRRDTGRHHRHGLDAATHFVIVNIRELRYVLGQRSLGWVFAGLFALFTLTG